MKFLLALLLLVLPAFAEQALPEKPDNRVYDDANIFEQSARERLVRVLDQEYRRNKIAVYVVTISDLDKENSITFADRLQKAWITEPIGFILLYTRSNDKISISLTPTAYKKLAEKSKIEAMASEIDNYNQEGPTRGVPKAVNAILNRLRISREDANLLMLPEKQTSPLLLLIPIGVVLLAFGWGLWRLFHHLNLHNVFDHTYRLRSTPVQPRFGALQGGVNIGAGKFR